MAGAGASPPPDGPGHRPASVAAAALLLAPASIPVRTEERLPPPSPAADAVALPARCGSSARPRPAPRRLQSPPQERPLHSEEAFVFSAGAPAPRLPPPPPPPPPPRKGCRTHPERIADPGRNRERLGGPVLHSKDAPRSPGCWRGFSLSLLGRGAAERFTRPGETWALSLFHAAFSGLPPPRPPWWLSLFTGSSARRHFGPGVNAVKALLSSDNVLVQQHKLSAHRGCVLWGDCVVIPEKLRQRILEALHVSHPGIIKMKALARCYVWWPNMDDAITAWVSACQVCQESRPAPPVAKGHTWEIPKTPWSRVHIDLASPFHGRTYMVVVDAYSKWLEVALMPFTPTEAVIRVLRGLFATHGCPDVLVSNNGPQFTSGTFERYLLGLGICHALTAPFHPPSNGQAERMVRSAKEALARLDQGDWHEWVAEYLFMQHITPHAATGRNPAELLMGCRLRSPLDRLHPDFAVAKPPGCANAPRSFVPGNQVFARNFVGDIPWVPATVVGVTGPRSYQVAYQICSPTT
ncbi:uncharacterized protein LOC144326225 [Podarcis muralis]